MKYSEVISEVLKRAGQEYVETGEDRARQLFRGAVADLILKGEYRESDLLGLIEEETVTFAADFTGSKDITDFGDVLAVTEIYPDPTGDLMLLVSRAKLDEVKRWAYSSSLKPSGSSVKYYEVGKNIKFVPAASLQSESLIFKVVKSPPEYSSTEEGKWSDDTEMLTYFSFGFLNRAIALAASYAANEFN